MVSRLVRTGIPALLTAAVLAVVALRQLRQAVNLDTFFHLVIGQRFLTDWAPWDPGQPTPAATKHWYPTQWLSQVALAGTDDVLGLRGVLWLSSAVAVAFMVVVMRTCRRESSLAVAAPLAAVVMLAAAPSISSRPQLVSYLLVVVVLGAWLATARDGRLRWWLVPLTWLWAMLHGMWVIGVVTSLAAAVGHVLDAPAATRRHALRALLVPVASFAAAGLTPVGPGLYEAVLAVGSRSSYFGEWAPTDFTSPTGAVVAALILLTVVARARTGPDLWLADLLLLDAIGWALYNSRGIPVSAALLAVLLARQLGRGPVAVVAPSRRERRTLLLGATAAVVAAGAYAALMPDPSPEEPAWMAPSLAALPTGTPVLSEIQYGSYLLWAHPEVDAAYNGYADAYTDAELKDVMTVLDLQPGWLRVLDRQGLDVALTSTDGPLAYALEHSAGWRVVHRSEDVVMLQRPPSEGSAG